MYMFDRRLRARIHAKECVYACMHCCCWYERARGFPVSQVGSRSIWFARACKRSLRRKKEEGIVPPRPIHPRNCCPLPNNNAPSVEIMSWLLRWNAVRRLPMELMHAAADDDDIIDGWLCVLRRCLQMALQAQSEVCLFHFDVVVGHWFINCYRHIQVQFSGCS